MLGSRFGLSRAGVRLFLARLRLRESRIQLLLPRLGLSGLRAGLFCVSGSSICARLILFVVRLQLRPMNCIPGRLLILVVRAHSVAFGVCQKFFNPIAKRLLEVLFQFVPNFENRYGVLP